MALPDVVYVVRPGEHNDSLRYSLRSIAANLPHRELVIAGYCPSWLTNVRCIPVPQRATKWRNSTANLRAAAEHPDVAESVVYANDDFYVLTPLDAMPVLHRGPVAEMTRAWHNYRGLAQYMAGATATARLLNAEGIPDPLCYEVHLPLPMTKTGLLEALNLPRERGVAIPVLHKRTLAANLARLGGTRIKDPKLPKAAKGWPDHWRFLSTQPGQLSPQHPVGQKLRDLLPSPSPYERRRGR